MNRSPTARLFVAVDPPMDVCDELAGWTRAATRGLSGRGAAQGPLRVLDPQLLHVTLCFLGERPIEEIDTIVTGLAACSARNGELSLGAPVWLPVRHPRALAVELHDHDGWLASLQETVAVAVQEVGGSHVARESGRRSTGRHRRFRPHLTVARMRSGAAPRERALPATPALAFVPSEMVLYRSWLSPEGAAYEALASYAIG